MIFQTASPSRSESKGSGVRHEAVRLAVLLISARGAASESTPIISVAGIILILRLHIVVPFLNHTCRRVDAVDIADESIHHLCKMPKIDMFQILRQRAMTHKR